MDIHSIHFIGVGGVGMSGIARVACAQGLTVSGSDLESGAYTRQLEECGAFIRYGHDAVNLAASGELPDVVVVSTAISRDNVEYVEARRLGIPVWHRAQMLAFLGRDKKTLAVSGTHGKTTTSSLLAYVLDSIEEDPTFVVGGILRNYSTNAIAGEGEYYVIEADESDKSFTYLNPYGIIVTNIEADHLDHYSGLDELYEKFGKFMSLAPESAPVVVCGEDKPLVACAKAVHANCITYGLDASNEVWVDSFAERGPGISFVFHSRFHGDFSCTLKQSPGIHNALNAAGVLAMVEALGLDIQHAVEALSSFGGAKRRFELVGECNGITIVDDYAHHPTEIKATIDAARLLPYSRVVVLFQPHRYSRLHLFGDVLHDEFASAFDSANQVFFTQVYSAGEKPLEGVNGESFMNIVLSHPDHPECEYFEEKNDVVMRLSAFLQPGDLLITMGAGDVTRLGPCILELLGRSDA